MDGGIDVNDVRRNPSRFSSSSACVRPAGLSRHTIIVVTLAVLVFGSWRPAAYPTASTTPTFDARDVDDWERRLASPYLHEREAARAELEVAGDEAAHRVRKLLRHRQTRVARAAAEILAKRPEWGSPTLIAERYRIHIDDSVRRDVSVALAGALAAHGKAGAEALLASGVAATSPAEFVFTFARVRRELERILRENTGPDGRFQGFFDGQFDGLPGHDSAGRALAIIARRPEFRIALRRAAVRAMGSQELDAHIPRLARARKRHVVRNGLADPTERPSWGMSSEELRDYHEDTFVEYVDYAFARCRNPEPLRERIAYHEREQNRWKTYLKLGVTEDDAKRIRVSIAYNLFRISYCHQQLRDFDRARRGYLTLAVDYRDTGEAPTAYYNITCMESLRGQVDRALHYFELALKAGYVDAEWIYKDNDLLNLRANPGFDRLMTQYGLQKPAELRDRGVRKANDVKDASKDASKNAERDANEKPAKNEERRS